MKIAILLLAALGLVGLAAVIIRLIPVDAQAQHLDPTMVEPPTSPNFVLRRGDGAASMTASLDQTAAALQTVIAQAGGVLLAGDLAEGHASYVFRSRIMGFPDVLSIRLSDASTRERLANGSLTEIEIYSRALMGFSDLGVNRARVDRLLNALAP